MEIKFTSWVIDWVRRDPKRVISRAPRQGGQDANLAASTCLRPFLKSTDCVGVDSLGGEGVCPSGYRPGVRQSLLSVLRWGIRTPRVFRLRCFQAGSKLVNLQT